MNKNEIKSLIKSLNTLRAVHDGIDSGSDTRPLTEKAADISGALDKLRAVVGDHCPPMISSLKNARLQKLAERGVQIAEAALRDAGVDPDAPDAPAEDAPKKAKKVKAKKAKAKKSEPVVGAHGESSRRIANAVKKLASSRRLELYTELVGDAPKKKALVKDVAKAIAVVMVTHDTLPDDVAANLTQKAGPTGPAKPKRIDTILECLKKGCTIDEIATALLEKFPNTSMRWGGKPATPEQYEKFARVAISHLRAGRVFAVAKDNPLTIVNEDKVYRIAS